MKSRIFRYQVSLYTLYVKKKYFLFKIHFEKRNLTFKNMYNKHVYVTIFNYTNLKCNTVLKYEINLIKNKNNIIIIMIKFKAFSNKMFFTAVNSVSSNSRKCKYYIIQVLNHNSLRNNYLIIWLINIYTPPLRTAKSHVIYICAWSSQYA